jgi:hypothetical protein
MKPQMQGVPEVSQVLKDNSFFTGIEPNPLTSYQSRYDELHSHYVQYWDTFNGEVPDIIQKELDGLKKILGVKDEEKSYKEMFLSSILDQTKDYPLPIPIINIIQSTEVIPFLTLKSFSLWQGKQKSKKTTVLAIAIASFLSGKLADCQPTQFEGSLDGKILFFDTEQGESYAARTMKLILSLAELKNSERFIYCDLREFSPTQRIQIIEAGIEETNGVKLVVIDGIVDLLNDFMDAKEGHVTITDILKLCSKYNIHIAGVLHQNKADKNARAHVGSIASQKCEIEISTEVDTKDRAQSIVSCLNSRGMPFEPFAIRWDKGSLPCINQNWDQVSESNLKSNRAFERAREIAEAVFKPPISFSHSEAVEKIMSIAKKSESAVKRYIKDWCNWGLITKSEDGRYRLFVKENQVVNES